MPAHTITWTIYRGGPVFGLVKCQAGEDAPCRLTCSAGCEEWGPDHEHPLVPTRDCLVAEWLHNDDPSECYDGPDDTLVVDGPIEVEWTGDGYVWRYPEPTP